MKNNIISLLFLLCISCQSLTKEVYSPLKLKGSESLNEVFTALKNDFEKLQDTLKVEIKGGGSRTGLTAIINGTADIGLSSYAFNLDSLLGDNHGIDQLIVAYDGIVLINNQENPIRRLSNDQISGIYTGTITDWSELGGDEGLILPVIRDSNSGTQQFFSTYFNIYQASSSAVVAKENSEILDSVIDNKNGIGFVGYSYFTSLVNNISLEDLSEPDSLVFIPPASRFINNGKYPLKRSLQIYFESNEDRRVNSFLTYLNSQRAKSIIARNGLILP